LDASGGSTNPTKSLCDKYVFNTVLSRTKSLIVAVGNPYALLKTEEKMGDNECWKTYIKHCIDNKTFNIPQIVEADIVKRECFIERLRARVCKAMHTISQQAVCNQNKVSGLPSPPHSGLPLKTPKDTSIIGKSFTLYNTYYMSQSVSECECAKATIKERFKGMQNEVVIQVTVKFNANSMYRRFR